MDEVTRRVGSVTRDGEPLRMVTLRRTYDVEPGRVWAELGEPDAVGRWLDAEPADLRVLDRAEPERLSLAHDTGGRTTYVDLSLRPVDGGTLLQVDHSVPHDGRWDDRGAAGVGLPWEAALAVLATRLGESGRGPDPSASAGEWAAAAIADGDEPAAARAAAARATR